MWWIERKHTRTAYVLMRHFCALRLQRRWRARKLRGLLYVLLAKHASATRLQRAWRLRAQVYEKAKACIASVGSFVTEFNYADAFTLYGPNLAAMFALVRRWRCFDRLTKLRCRLVLQCYLMVFHKSVWPVRLDTQSLGFMAMCTQAELITELVNRGLDHCKIEKNMNGPIDRYLELNLKWQSAMNWTNRFSYMSITYSMIYQKETVPETTTAGLIKMCGLTRGENADWVRNVWYADIAKEPVYRLHVDRTSAHARYELEHNPSFCFDDATILSDQRIADIRNLVPVTFASMLDGLGGADKEARLGGEEEEARLCGEDKDNEARLCGEDKDNEARLCRADKDKEARLCGEEEEARLCRAKKDNEKEARLCRPRKEKEEGHEKKATGQAAEKLLRTQIRLDVGNNKEIRKSAILTRIVRYNFMMKHYFEELEGELNVHDFIKEVLECNAPAWRPWLDRMCPQAYISHVLVPYLAAHQGNKLQEALLEALFMIEDALMVAVVARDTAEVRGMPAVILTASFIENRKEWFRQKVGLENLEGVKIPLPHRFPSLACQRVGKYFACLVSTNNELTRNAPVWDQIRLITFAKTYKDILEKVRAPRPHKSSRIAEIQNKNYRKTFGLQLSRGLILASLSRRHTVQELAEELDFAGGTAAITRYFREYVTFCEIHFRVFGALYATFDA